MVSFAAAARSRLSSPPEKDESKREAGIKVVISDGSQISCELLAGALKRARQFTVLSCATNSQELYEAVADQEPDVALISVSLADGPYAGMAVLRKIRQGHLRTRCVLIIDSSDREIVTGAFRSGARGVFCRSNSLHLLCRCIASVHGGQFWATSAELEYVVDAFQAAMPLSCVNSSGNPLLTRREQELLPLVADGLTNHEISQRLNISEHTVKNHLFRMYEKLGISSRVELILYACSRRAEADGGKDIAILDWRPA